ncbi:uncharacterized protein BJX67DRAFT_382171 [Aspergillus lucknowensis]|uniref:Dienelactone hydrolase domain-containing protein n=1 Tax=Aspergillus lucknowensis TaxID=176173 RepID=A0ABR4LPM3_9EURO
MTCEACRSIPPVASTGTEQGQYEEIAGLNTYITGPRNSRIGLVCVYDVFGLTIQTLQGADRLARQLGATVLVPDLFHGDAMKPEWFPRDAKGKKELATKFLSEKAGFSSVDKWGAYGLCWGAKFWECGLNVPQLVILNSGAETPFAASGQVHPSRLDKFDAENLTIPHIVLASKDEPADVVEEYRKIVSSNGLGGYIETYDGMWHGWMGARANLDDELGYREYTRGYDKLAEFFAEHLK